MRRTRSRASEEGKLEADVPKQVDRLAELLCTSRHVVFCTGAGISTNSPANLRDYRGPDGIWTEAQAAGLVTGEPGAKGMPVDCPWDESMYRRMPAAQPTFAHRVIALLTSGDAPLVRHVITQNEDGLHRRSGVPAERLSELHGSAFVELCGAYKPEDDTLSSSSNETDSSDDARTASKAEIVRAMECRPAGCGATITRDFVTYYPDTYKRSWPLGRHVTGRACPHCRVATEDEARRVAHAYDATVSVEKHEGGCVEHGASVTLSELSGTGWLVDSTVDFGESPEGFPWGRNSVHALRVASEHMRHADLVVAWGTSLCGRQLRTQLTYTRALCWPSSVLTPPPTLHCHPPPRIRQLAKHR